MPLPHEAQPRKPADKMQSVPATKKRTRPARSIAVAVGTLVVVLATACYSSAPEPTATLRSPAATPLPTLTPTPLLSALVPPTPTLVPPWRRDDRLQASASPLIPRPTPTPAFRRSDSRSFTIPAPDSQAILEQSFSRMMLVESFHFEFDASMMMRAQGILFDIPFQMYGDIAQPDRMQAHMNISLLGESIATDAISVAGVTYVRDPDTGRWLIDRDAEQQVPIQPGDLLMFGEDNSTGLVTGLEALEYLGDEVVDGALTHLFAGAIPVENLDGGFAGREGSVVVGFWIDTEDLWLRRMVFEGTIPLEPDDSTTFGNGSEFPGGEMDLQMLFNLSRFNEPVSIELPAEFR